MEAASAQDREVHQWIDRGDLRRAGDSLIKRYAGEVFGLCHAMVHDRAAAEDLTQDTFSKAFSGIADFRGEASFRTWILKIARNRCIDYLRTRGREPWNRVDDEIDEPRDLGPLPAELLIRRDDVRRALGELSEGERALVVLRFGHGLGYPELARTFGLKEGAVRMRISRALGKMRSALESDEKRGTDGMRAFSPAAASVAAPLPAAPRGRFRITSRKKRAATAAAESAQDPLAHWLQRNLPRPSNGVIRRLQKRAKALS